jgi:hypothetical protein
MLALAELGLPGFTCVMMLVFGNIHSNMRLRKALLAMPRAVVTPDHERTMRLLDMTSAAAVGFAVSGAFLSATYYPHMYVLTALLLSARTFAGQVSALKTATNGTGMVETPDVAPAVPRYTGWGINPEFRPKSRARGAASQS